MIFLRAGFSFAQRINYVDVTRKNAKSSNFVIR